MTSDLAPRQDTVTRVLAKAVDEFPERIFLDFSGEMYTYAQVDARATRLANGLATLGVKRGDRVGALLDTSLDAIVVWLGANKLGAIYVPVNTAYKGEYLRHQLSDAGVEVVFAEPQYVQRLDKVRAGLPTLRMVVQRGDADPASKHFEVRRFNDILGSDDPLADANQVSDISMLIYTWGTSGPAKGCIISHNYICNLARQTARDGNRTADDINWSPLPLNHISSLGSTVLACAVTGARASLYPRFSVTNFWPEIERSGATIANLLGSTIAFVAGHPDNEASKRCFGQLRIIRGSPFSAELQATWRSRFGVKTAGSSNYGQTEACAITSLSDSEYGKPGSSGKRNADFEVRIVDEDDNELPANTPGEVIVRPRRAHIMMEGYWGRPSDTLKIMKNLWLHTGDLGMFDEDGFFYFVDRKKDRLRRRGENISSYEVETTFRAHPAVKDVAVHAVFSETSEDEVKATIVLKSGAAPLTPAELCAWSVDRLPYFAVPRYIEFRMELPRNPVGRVMCDQGCTAATWDRERAEKRWPPRRQARRQTKPRGM